MRRRALLAALATGSAGLAGCSVPGSDPGTVTPAPVPSSEPPGTTDEPTDQPTGRPADELPMPDQRASVIELETTPRTYAFRPTSMHTDDGAHVALWFDRTATDDHPARLRGWLRNQNDFANTFQIEWIPAVGRIHARQPDGYDHEASLHLAPTENNEIATSVPDLARTDDGLWIARDVGPWMPETHRLEPGEQIALEYVVVGERNTPGRPTGEYEFRGRDDTVTLAVWDTNSPGPAESSRFQGRTVPTFDGDRTIKWYHESDARALAFVRPSAERVDLDAAIDFEMVNHSHESLRCGHWNLHKLVDGEWFHVGPNLHTSDCRGLAPGERLTWTLRAFNGDSVSCGAGGCGGQGLTRGYLGGGTYAVVAGYGHPTDASGAILKLVGDPVEVVPTDGATAQREEDTVVVTAAAYGDGEDPPDDSFSLVRTDSADERLIAEQVMEAGAFVTSGNGLRDALAAFEDGVERVVVRADERVVDGVLGYISATRRFSFRGQAYEANRDVESE